VRVRLSAVPRKVAGAVSQGMRVSRSRLWSPEAGWEDRSSLWTTRLARPRVPERYLRCGVRTTGTCVDRLESCLVSRRGQQNSGCNVYALPLFCANSWIYLSHQTRSGHGASGARIRGKWNGGFTTSRESDPLGLRLLRSQRSAHIVDGLEDLSGGLQLRSSPICSRMLCGWPC
jgi:hypothetical protein